MQAKTVAVADKKLRKFTISEPFDIPLDPKRLLDGKTCAANFFKGRAGKYRGKVGCYIFALRGGRGSTPYYVGKTNRSFEEEAFATHKVSNHYQPVLLRHQGTPTMTFVVLEESRGKTPESTLKDIEKYLIQAAYAKNSNLSNVQNLPKTRWTIEGVMNATKGQPTKTIQQFKGMMGI